MRNHKLPCRALALAVCMLIWTAPVRANATVYKNAVAATGWVIVPAESASAMGTCWIIDQQRKLAITSCHVTGDALEVLVYFPIHTDGKLVVTTEKYLQEMQAINGRVITRDRRRDLALIQLESLPDGAKALTMANQSAQPGDDVHSIGNSGLAKKAGVLWRYTRGNVRQVYAKQLRSGGKAVTLVETQSPVNFGDSGGPLLNDRGEVVGLTMAYDKEQRLVSYSVDVSEIRRFLAGALPRIDKYAKTTVELANQKLLGTWKVTAKAKDVSVSGTAEFTQKGLYLLTESHEDESEPQRARFSYANGVLLIITTENQASFRLTWASKDEFTFSSGGIDLTFHR